MPHPFGPLLVLLLACQALTAQPTPRPLRIAGVVASDSEGENLAEHVVDGVPGTRWATGQQGADLTLDLGVEATVSTCRVRWVGKADRIYAFDLQTSADGTTWQTVLAGGRSTAVHGRFVDYPLPPTAARFVRLHCLGSNENSWTHIDEVRFLGTGGLPAPADDPQELPESAVRRVGDETSFSGFGYYGICPESPSGTRICYTRFVEPPTTARARYAAELWVCDHDLTHQRKVADLAGVGTHNAAMGLWLDEHRIAYQAGGQTYVVDADNGQTLLGPLDGQLQHNLHAGEFLICCQNPDLTPDRQGLYAVNAQTGALRLLLPISVLQPFTERVGEPDLSRWRLQHAQWSTDGSCLAVKIYAGKGKDWSLVTCRADGTDLAWFGHKPMHFQWYDGDTLFGHDSEVEDGLPNTKDLRRWRRDGTVVATLAGYGCHPALSPDRQWVATESWYGSDPVRLMLYQRGQTRPARILGTFEPATAVWDLSAHVNAAFSRDGKRVYFSRPVAPGLSQAYCVDLDLETP